MQWIMLWGKDVIHILSILLVDWLHAGTITLVLMIIK